MILRFEYYLSKGVVKKCNKNCEKAKSLIKKARKRIEVSQEIKIPSFRLEFAYEAIIEAIEALLSVEGYKSYSHEADISFLRKVGFSEMVVLEVDRLRRKRHRSKYYGLEFSNNDANDAVRLAKKIMDDIILILKRKGCEVV